MRLTVLLLLALPLTTSPARAPDLGDALLGTWSGHWDTADGYTGVTVRFVRTGYVVTGEMLSPTHLEFAFIAFDERTGTLVVEAESRASGWFGLDARLIKYGTRLKGTLTHDDMAGGVMLKKWIARHASVTSRPPNNGAAQR